MRVRSGFVSNSSSSSFVLLDKKDVSKSIELFAEYVMGDNFEDGSFDATKREAALKVFIDKLNAYKEMTAYEIASHFAYIMLEFKDFYDIYLSMHQSGMSFDDKDDYRVDEYNSARLSFLSYFKNMPCANLLRPLILKMKKYIEDHIEYIEDNGEFYGCPKDRDFSFIMDECNSLGEEWVAINGDALQVWFASDDGNENEANVRFLVFGFCDYCNEKGLGCFATDNS